MKHVTTLLLWSKYYQYVAPSLLSHPFYTASFSSPLHLFLSPTASSSSYPSSLPPSLLTPFLSTCTHSPSQVQEGCVVRLRGLPFQASLKEVAGFLVGLNCIPWVAVASRETDTTWEWAHRALVASWSYTNQWHGPMLPCPSSWFISYAMWQSLVTISCYSSLTSFPDSSFWSLKVCNNGTVHTQKLEPGKAWERG